jgi:hypothetical protein
MKPRLSQADRAPRRRDPRDHDALGGQPYTVPPTLPGVEVTIPSPPAPPRASIAAPAPGGTYTLDQIVPTTFSCVEGASPGLASCDDSTGTSTTAGGQGALDTSTLGAHTYTVTASSKDGQTGVSSITYTVTTTPASGTGSTSGSAPSGGSGSGKGSGSPGTQQQLSLAILSTITWLRHGEIAVKAAMHRRNLRRLLPGRALADDARQAR